MIDVKVLKRQDIIPFLRDIEKTYIRDSIEMENLYPDGHNVNWSALQSLVDMNKLVAIVMKLNEKIVGHCVYLLDMDVFNLGVRDAKLLLMHIDKKFRSKRMVEFVNKCATILSSIGIDKITCTFTNSRLVKFISKFGYKQCSVNLVKNI